MKDRVCLISGGTSGIGKATAIALAKKGAQVVIIGRSEKKARTSVEEIISLSGNAMVDYLVGDLSSQKSIRLLAADFNTKYEKLHVLINNAGTFYSTLNYSTDKIEMQFALNHLSYFLLTGLLLEKIKQSAPARVINVSSRAHRFGKIHFEDLNLEQGYNGLKAYAQSKLANILFTYKLAEKLQGCGVTVNCLHPGGVKTGIGSSNSAGFYKWIWELNPFLIPVEAGAKTPVYLASSGDVALCSGKYFFKCREAKSSKLSYNPELAERLWKVSERLIGFV